MTTDRATHKAVLVLPHIRVQNANAISSPLTWGFPSITAFTGLMTALARRLGPDAGVEFCGVGVVCHACDPQVDEGAYTRSFRLTRNPNDKSGNAPAIIEEGRVHLEVTLVFEVEIADLLLGEDECYSLAKRVSELVSEMRVAGGSVIFPIQAQTRSQPRLFLLPDNPGKRGDAFRRLCRRWLPGFALVARDDLMLAHVNVLRQADPKATLLDAWLDLCRLNQRAVRRSTSKPDDDGASEEADWVPDDRAGWIVPIPVGFASISELHRPGSVEGARDPNIPFRFVESVYSVGQWISPHRLRDLSDLVWKASYDRDKALYRCVNAYRPIATFDSSIQASNPI